MQNGLVMAAAPGIPRTWETLFFQALRVIGEPPASPLPHIDMPAAHLTKTGGNRPKSKRTPRPAVPLPRNTARALIGLFYGGR